ncbi:MAG: tetratricopeptide repeat protein [Bacteroidota bacterium]|nr:tetratricopeptide repeat protein [Bacteroidota bacterium]
MIVFITSCQKKGLDIRVITDKDTSYSLDIRSVSEKINKNPQSAELYFNRANAFYFEDNLKEAIIDINAAIYYDSINADYHYYHGKYLMSGDTANSQLAENAFLKALHLKNNYSDAHQALAYLYLAKQQYDLAEIHYTEASKITPSNPEPIFYLGMIAKEIGDTAKAILLFEKTLVYDSKHYDAIMQLGLFYANKNDKKTIVFLDRALAINEYSDEALYAKGLYFQNNQKLKEASILYENCIRVNPSHIFSRYNLALLNAMALDYDNAIKNLDAAIGLSPDYADAYTLRGRVFEMKKDKTRAYFDYVKAINLDDNQTLAKEGLKRVNINVTLSN